MSTEYGHGGHRVDAHGHPIQEVYNATGAGTGAHGTTGVAPYGTTHPQGGVAGAAGGGGHGILKPGKERGLRRSGSSSSSSSSSSEDDGMGGRRKKGIKQKIKEKLPGGNKPVDQPGYAGQTAPMTTTGTAAGGGHEKKGMMEKIKEKLPGGSH